MLDVVAIFPRSTLENLAIRNQSMSGTLPPAWGQASSSTRSLLADANSVAFPELQELLLDHNTLTGEEVQFCKFSACLLAVKSHAQQINRPTPPSCPAGSLPASWASASAFPALRTMDLEHNQLSGQLGAEWTAGKPYAL